MAELGFESLFVEKAKSSAPSPFLGLCSPLHGLWRQEFSQDPATAAFICRIFNFIQRLDLGVLSPVRDREGRKYSMGLHYVPACRHPVSTACFV